MDIASRDGAERMKLLLSASVSSWQPQLAAVPIADQAEGQPYWLVPFQNYKAVCPFLVGSHEQGDRTACANTTHAHHLDRHVD